MAKLSETLAFKEIGQYGTNTKHGSIRADEFLQELKGRKAVKKFREMRDNDSTVGAVCYATEQVLRDVDYTVEPADDSEAAKKEAEFVESVLQDMEHTLDDHISEALSFLSYGFATFEVVYKRRVGPSVRSPKKRSMYSDGRIGVRKIASRAQWTISKFEVDEQTGDLLGIHQDQSWGYGRANLIPASKLIHYRTTNLNGDPSGRSILRNAYPSYVYLNNLQAIEAIGAERELTGIPVGRMPAEYLSDDATSDQAALRTNFEKILRDLKRNEQGYALLPSDVYTDADGKPLDIRLMDIELISSNGKRDFDLDPIIKRYQHDIARSVMAEFLMLGGTSTGSFALSKSKTDLFLRSMEAYINTIFDVINRQLVRRLWDLNGLDYGLMPKIVPGDVAPHDLRELGAYLRNLNGAEINLSDQPDIVDALLANAELPLLDRDIYEENLEREKEMAERLANQPTPQENPEGPPQENPEAPTPNKTDATA